VAWTLGLTIYGLLVGSVVHGIADEIGDSAQIREIIARFGGTAGVETAFIAISFSFLGMSAAAQSVSATLRLHAEESAGRAETALAASVGRFRWAASHLVFAVAGPAVALLSAGVVAGLAYGAAAGDVGGTLPGVLEAAAVQLPSVWLVGAITLALFGTLPRFAPAAWGVLVAFVALYFLGSVSGMPQWVLDLSPFSHTPRVPGEALRPAPLLWLLGGTGALTVLGLSAFRRRDLR
jgi:ABC-2 type transport system permease protein